MKLPSFATILSLSGLLAFDVAAFSSRTQQSAKLVKIRQGKSTQLDMVGTSIVPKLAIKVGAIAASAALASTGLVKLVLDKPSRAYAEGTVAQEYDDWANEGILEYYWGEHIHLGYYGPEVNYRNKPLQEAQFAFIDEMMKCWMWAVALVERHDIWHVPWDQIQP
jgi:hypothetical protein